MTSPILDRDKSADRAQTFLDWTRINAKALTIAAVAVVLAAGVYWVYVRTKENQAARAAQALLTAKSSIGSGNLPLAHSDLQNIVNKWQSTNAGVEASMLLAGMDYDQGKFSDGIKLLQDAENTGPGREIAPTLESLIGDGYMSSKQASKAADAYSRAANVSRYEAETATNKAKAARAYEVAGDTAKSIELWTWLSTDPAGASMASEAKVRLGELEAAHGSAATAAKGS
jgi:predicted negative regulator of RcsB-dependent stress response